MKKLLIGLSVLLGAVVLAALVGPHLVDLSRYKGVIADRVRAATGRELAIDGPVSFDLLPSPRLSVAGVRLANLPGAAVPDMVRLKAFELRVALLPLLSGRVQIESLALIEPHILLERLKNGDVNWEFVPEGASATPAPDMSATPFARLRLDRLMVSGGTIAYQDDETGARDSLDKLDGAFAMDAGTGDAGTGPVRAQGRASWRDLPVGFDVNLERLGGAAPAGLSVKLAFAGARLDFSGSLARQDTDPTLAGTLKLNGADLRGSVAALGIEGASLPAFLAQDFGFEAGLEAKADRLALKFTSLRLGASEAAGTLDIQSGKPMKIAAKFGFDRIDLDKLLAVQAPPLPLTTPPPPSSPSPNAPGGANPPPDQSAGFVLPRDIDVSLDVNADAIIFRDGVMRQAVLGAGLKDGALTLDRFSVALPGSADLTVYGALRTPGGAPSAAGPSFTGNVELDADNLRDLLLWLKLDPGTVPAERLRKLAFKAALQVTPSQFLLRDGDATLDSSHIRGGATMLLQKRPAFGASFAIDRLNLDAYLPQGAGAPPAPPVLPDQGASPSPAPASGKGAANPFDKFDGNILARVDELIYRGQSIHGIKLDGSVAGGAVTLHDGQVDDLAGVKLQLSGGLEGYPAQPKLDLAFDADSADATAFLRFVDVKSPIPPARFGAVSLKGHLKGWLDALGLDLDAGLAGGEYKLGGTLGFDGHVGGARDFGYDLDLAFKGPQLGGFALEGKAKGNPTTLALSAFKAKLGEASLSGALDIAFAGPRPKLTAKLAAEALDLDALFSASPAASDGAPKPPLAPGSQGAAGSSAARPWSTAPIQLIPLQAADADVTLTAPQITYGQFKLTDAALSATLANGVLDLSPLTGKLYGGDLKITGRIEDAVQPLAHVTLNLDGANLGQAGLTLAQLRLTGGSLRAAADLQTKGRSMAALVQGLGGTGSFKMTDGTVQGFDLAGIGTRLNKTASGLGLLNLVQGAMAGGQTKVKSLAGTVAVKDGVARNDDLALDAEGVSGKGQGTIDLPRWNMDYQAAFQIAGVPGAPPFFVKLTGAPDEPRKFLNANALQEFIVKRAAGSVIDKPALADPGAAAAPAAKPKPPSNAPADIIENVLKDLGKKP